uniref:Methyltransferase type 11 domain-containing protein n=1 Tax=viral metagenome TaxID=1070528 RepID=A0A6C0EVU4_9ZZZZ
MILYLLILLFIIYLCFTRKEGFTNDSFEYKTYVDDNIYDKYYAYIYDDIWNMIPLYEEQINIMKPYFGSTNNFLTLNCKTGHMCQLLYDNMRVVGLDNSKEMIKMAKHKYPKIDFIKGDYEPSIFKENLFTHIFCPLFTINCIKDLKQFNQCIDKWLVHKGYLFVTTYEKFNISSVINKSPSNCFKSKYDYTVELNSKLTEKIIHNNDVRTNIQYLKNVDINNICNFDLKIIRTIEMPIFKCFLSILQKN